MKEIKIFNLKVQPLSRSEFISIIKSNLAEGIRMAQFGVNSATVNEVLGNEEFRQAINKADLFNIDGMSVVWALRCLGYKVPERVATPDLADEILAMAEKEKFSIYLLGAKEQILTACREKLNESFPKLNIAGSQNGYYRPEDEDFVIETINNTQPDILFIGMSSPRKELFFEKYRDVLNAKYILGVGGYFDILSGYTKRAPKWMQNIGLEWIFRLMQEPGRMWRRYLIGNNQFLWVVFKEKFKSSIK
jgi:N-acetylglucosaminyldiphosphoundecaprenol N-acetyl-beta-D-mannosaminyltransferase